MPLSVLDILDMSLEERTIIRALSDLPNQTIDQIAANTLLEKETILPILQRMMSIQSVCVSEGKETVYYSVSLVQARNKTRTVSASSVWDTF